MSPTSNLLRNSHQVQSNLKGWKRSAAKTATNAEDVVIPELLAMVRSLVLVDVSRVGSQCLMQLRHQQERKHHQLTTDGTQLATTAGLPSTVNVHVRVFRAGGPGVQVRVSTGTCTQSQG